MITNFEIDLIKRDFILVKRCNTHQKVKNEYRKVN